MQAVSQVAREQLSQRWVENDARERNSRARRVYYLSMEFLIGRSLSNALAALDRYHIIEQWGASLKRLQRDRIDLYFLHEWDGQTPV